GSVPPSRRPAAYIERVMRRYGLDESWTWIDVESEEYGLTGSRLQHFIETADAFVNVTGAGRIRDRYRAVPHRAYIDTDPGYVQFRTARWNHDSDWAMLNCYTSHFSFAHGIGGTECTIPDLGLRWHHTVQPVDLRLWPSNRPVAPDAPLTTIVK